MLSFFLDRKVLYLPMFKVLTSLTILFAQASDCQFSYINYGEDLVYQCADSSSKIEVTQNQVIINGKVAPQKVQVDYQNWKKSKESNQAEMNNQKDKFNCSP